MTEFSQFIQKIYSDTIAQLPDCENKTILHLREKGKEYFDEINFSSLLKHDKRLESIQHLDSTSYQIQLQPPTYRPVEEYFKCKVKNIDTQMSVFLNGWFVHDNQPLVVSPDGLIVGSIFAALKQFPELVLPYLTTNNRDKKNEMFAMNKMLFNDGLFIYVPDNLIVEKPIQLISLIDTAKNLLINNRNMIILGKNSSLTFVQCDDSIHFQKSFINNATDIHLSENSELFYYKMENKDPDSLLFNDVHVIQKSHSSFYSNAMTFNAGFLKNRIDVDLTEPFASAKLYGLYLVDKQQHVDSQIFIDHQVPDCESYELYKGIADDEAIANFKGHVVVRPDAQRTLASQTNRNITLTDEARITSQPFLEIYADNVKCNHGTTVGQLDDDALFYMRSRGICERNARMLLMFAFANEIANYVKIESLQTRLKEMIRKRLNGELTVCDQCVLHCTKFLKTEL